MGGLNLKPAEAAERLRVSPNTLKCWRMTGGGPRYLKLGRMVLYPVREIEAFERSHMMNATTVAAH